MQVAGGDETVLAIIASVVTSRGVLASEQSSRVGEIKSSMSKGQLSFCGVELDIHNFL